MKIPPNMTEKEVLDTMNVVVNRIAPKYTFYGYDVHDIKQESYIICIDALERYDCVRPLENFLSVNLSNRLKNFIRDNHFMANADAQRIKIAQPAQLEFEETLLDENEKFSVDESIYDYQYLSDYIDKYLPASYRMDYLKMINNVYLPKTRKEELVTIVKEIMEECGYEEG